MYQYKKGSLRKTHSDRLNQFILKQRCIYLSSAMVMESNRSSLLDIKAIFFYINQLYFDPKDFLAVTSGIFLLRCVCADCVIDVCELHRRLLELILTTLNIELVQILADNSNENLFVF